MKKLLLALIVAAQAPSLAQTDDQFLDTLQHAAFNFFWEQANPVNGLIKDRNTYGSDCSIASEGFGLTAICVAIDHGWITRQSGRDRVLNALTTFWLKPQGTSATNAIGYKGFFYHFLDMATGLRAGTSELSSIDTGLLLAGVLYAKAYFSTTDSLDGVVRALADSIYCRVDWQWMMNSSTTLSMGWTPESGFLGARWYGYNEAMILQILALGSPTHPAPSYLWNYWTSTYSWQTLYGQSYVVFPPLFGHQYSHCWIDFRYIADIYMQQRGITYFENSRRATLAQRAYCVSNPGHFTGYSDTLWGLTACDGPPPTGYNARGAPPAQNDDGTIAPTAVAGSLPFAPEVCLPTLRSMDDMYHASLWMQYGFRDAFNLTQNWWDTDVIGIDEGPIVLMIENYRTGGVWHLFMQDPAIQLGLQRAGFITVSAVQSDLTREPGEFRLEQNFPNPFNASSEIGFRIPGPGYVTLKVYDVLGREVAVLVNERREPGRYEVTFDGGGLSSGVYVYRLTFGHGAESRKMILMK